MPILLVTSSFRITCWRHTLRCLTLSLTYCRYLQLQNNWVTLHLLMRHLKWRLFWLPLPLEWLSLNSNMGVQPSVQPMLVRCTFRITELHYTCGCQPLVNAYLYQLYLRNHCVTLNLMVSSLKCSLWSLGLLTESLDHTRLMVALATVQLMLAGLHQTSGCPTLTAAYVG